MRSSLLEGRVRHRRLNPTDYRLDHAVYYVSLDLDELDEVVERSRLIRRNQPWIVELRDADHLPTPATDLRADVRAHLRSDGLEPDGWNITLITNLRVLGYVFNPASFFLCRDRANVLRAVIVEVHNTHGERHLYTLQTTTETGPGDAVFAAGMAKAFYVSPFIGMQGSYEVFVRDAAERLSIAITESDPDGRLLTTSLVLRRQPLTDARLLSMLVRHPLMPQRTIALIHWHALRLWLRGIPFLRHGGASSTSSASAIGAAGTSLARARRPREV